MYIIALIAIAVGVGSFFKISDIQVSGNVLYSEQEIAEASKIELGKNLILLNKRRIVNNILDSKTYVDSVTVKRKFPSTVQLVIRESKLLAYLEYGETCYVINRRCKILSPGDAASVAGYIHILGAAPQDPEVGEQLSLGEGEGAKLDYLADVMEQLMKKELYPYVQWIDMSNVASVKFLYRGSLTIDLGRNEGLEKKFDILERILQDLSENDRGIINLATAGEGHYIPQ